MNYRLEELDNNVFERLINSICQELLGIGIISFAEGKDGGRDGKFTGRRLNIQIKKTAGVASLLFRLSILQIRLHHVLIVNLNQY